MVVPLPPSPRLSGRTTKKRFFLAASLNYILIKGARQHKKKNFLADSPLRPRFYGFIWTSMFLETENSDKVNGNEKIHKYSLK